MRGELISKIDNDLPIYNERGKQKLLELIDGLDDVKQNCWCGLVVLGGASVYEFEILSYIHSTIKPFGPAGKQEFTISWKYPYNNTS